MDFILGDHTAIEVKAKENVGPHDVRSLRAIAEEKSLKRFICVSFEHRQRRVDSITILPVGEFLAALWAGEFK